MSRRHFLSLLFSFVFAALVGSSVRIIFSPQRLQEIVSQALKSDTLIVDFTAQKMELSLARGAWPQIALRVEGLEIIENDQCFHNTIWQINEIFFPLRISGLIHGQLLLGKIIAQNIEVNLGSTVGISPCLEIPRAPVEPKSRREPQAEKTIPKKNLFDVISGIYVSQLKVRHQAYPSYTFKANDLILWTQPDNIGFSGTATASITDLGINPLPSVSFVGGVEKGQVNARLLGRWQEGVINVDVNYSLTENTPTKISGQMKHLPLANFLKVYEQVNGQATGTYPRSMWLNCEMKMESGLEGLSKSTLTFSNCLVEGDAGTWESSRLVYDVGQGVFREPFEIKLAKLPLKTVMDALQINVLDGVLDEYGLLSGNIRVNPPGELEFSGFVEDMEVYFSNKDVRARQGIKKVSVEIQKKDGRISGQFSNFEMQKAQMDGLISFNFDKGFKNGYVQTQAKNLILDPSIQELLVKEKLGKIEAYGKFKVSDGRLEIFKGNIGVEDIENQDAKVKSLKSDVSFIAQNLKVGLKAKSILINTTSAIFNGVRPLLLDKKFENNWLELSDLSVSISGVKQQLEWKKGVVLVPMERISIVSEGVWQEGAGLAGWVSVDFPSLKLMRWEVSGEVANPRFLPSSQWLKELVTEKPKKKKK